ncbi:MAG: hypothetical protein J6O50_03765 [Ruminiclostridium sp.]|nr:hypothetical protein [Ruminiclostridium sp.]
MMNRFVPAEKLSKKERKRLSSVGRGSWGAVNPVTRVADTDKRRYKRKPKHTHDMYDA